MEDKKYSYVVLGNDGLAGVTENLADVNTDLVTRIVEFEDNRTAWEVFNMLVEHRRINEEKARPDLAIAQGKIAEQAVAIRDFKNRIARLHDDIDQLRAFTIGAFKLLSRIAATLAIGTIEHSTHAERNEKSREIVRAIRILLLNVNENMQALPPQDMDDIPF